MTKTYDVLIKEHSNTLLNSDNKVEKEKALAELIRIIKHITYQEGYTDGRALSEKLGT